MSPRRTRSGGTSIITNAIRKYRSSRYCRAATAAFTRKRDLNRAFDAAYRAGRAANFQEFVAGLENDGCGEYMSDIAFRRGGLASFKVPRQIHLVGEWPMSGTGKIQRFLLKEAAATM